MGKKQILINAVVKNGKFIQEDGKPIPDFHESSLLNIIANERDIKNNKDIKKVEYFKSYELEEPKLIIKKGSSLIVLIPTPIKLEFTPGFRYQARPGNGLFSNGVEIRTLVDLYLNPPRGYNLPRLEICRCEIPSIGKEARSLNHAYSLISTKHEPRRLHHTGNVFKKITYLDIKKDKWLPLENLRKENSFRSQRIYR